jgi:hypothetical protein
MNQSNHFDAPWGWLLTGVTATLVLLLSGFLVAAAVRADATGIVWPLLALIAGAFFVIRGYELAGDVLRIERLGWRSHIKLQGLRSVIIDPALLRCSLRVGNGGFFCFSGWFRNRKLGWYRLFATDPRRAVLRRFDDRKVVVTPDDPELFAAQVKRLAGLL